MNICSTNVVTSTAHSKIILIGEHAVVYGHPAIAIPFPLEVQATVKEKPGEMMFAFNHDYGPVIGAQKHMQGLAECVKATLQYLGKPLEGISIAIHSVIPVARGLGASAAIAVAVVRSLFSFYRRTASDQEILELAQISEVYAHGNPSGIDLAAVVSDTPIWFQKEGGAVPFKIHPPLHIVVADTGERSDTLTAVQSVKEKLRLEPEVVRKSMELIAELAETGKTALANGNPHLFGEVLNLNHSELKKLGVSNASLDNLTDRARNTGALGAKMTGSGQGGCMIAIAPSSEQAKAIAYELKKVGAKQTWYYTI